MSTTRERRRAIAAIVVRAALYALAVVALVLWGTEEPHVFIYQGF